MLLGECLLSAPIRDFGGRRSDQSIAGHPSVEHAGGERAIQLATAGYRNASRRDHAGQTSVPNDRPPTTRTQTTGQTNPDPTVKEMNEDAKRRIEREGK
jgi:hypothetical protein